MHRMLVEERRWIAEDLFLHALNSCMLLPGPEAMQLATCSGWRLHGTIVGLAAGLLFMLPGATGVLALSIAYAYFGQLPIVEAAFIGIKAAVLVIVIEALLSWASPRRHRGRSSSSPSSSASSPTSARAASRSWPSTFSALPSHCGRPSRSAFSGSSSGRPISSA